MYQFKAKDSEIKDYAQCLGNVSKYFTINNMKKTGLKGVVQSCPVDFNPIDNNDILDIHKYLMKKTWYKIMFGLIKKIFIVFFSSTVNASNHTKCVLLSNQKCNIQPSLSNLHPNESSQEFYYYPFSVKLDACVGRWNSLIDLSKKVCIPNKTEDLNLSVFNMVTGIKESKTLAKHISCECKWKYDGTKSKWNQWWNNENCQCECKKIHVCEKDYVWNTATCNCKTGII